ncbi:hypothetical protein CK507_00650 [Pseudomonas sp. WN033]|nr:hypothetical protein CK507_00650 [Pseudomonas sp. WN033]
MNQPAPTATNLPAREVYQRLKDVCLGTATARRHGQQGWNDVHSGLVTIEIDGWLITLNKEAGALDYCAACTTTDGRRVDMHSWAERGTDPLELLSVWELGRLEAVLETLN